MIIVWLRQSWRLKAADPNTQIVTYLNINLIWNDSLTTIIMFNLRLVFAVHAGRYACVFNKCLHIKKNMAVFYHCIVLPCHMAMVFLLWDRHGRCLCCRGLSLPSGQASPLYLQRDGTPQYGGPVGQQWSWPGWRLPFWGCRRFPQQVVLSNLFAEPIVPLDQLVPLVPLVWVWCTARDRQLFLLFQLWPPKPLAQNCITQNVNRCSITA